MGKSYRIAKPEPEFYFHFTLKQPIAELKWKSLSEKGF